MLREKLSLVILSCDNYCDLWDWHIKFLEKYWGNREIKTYIVSETNCDRNYDRINIYAAGEKTSFSERFSLIMQEIDTKYALVVLDDYFLVENVINEEIERLVDAMEKECVSYLNLSRFSPLKSRLNGYNDIGLIDLYSSEYAVNLFVSIFEKDFAQKTSNKSLSAWEYEVSLTKYARKNNVKCAVGDNKYYCINDIIRKGRIQRKNIRFLKENDVILPNRKLTGLIDDFIFNLKLFIKKYVPRPIWKFIKKIMKMLGFKFYSD